PNLRARIAFIFLSKLYRQMYAGTGISTDSARRKKSKKWARWTARQCKKLFRATPMPKLQKPTWEPRLAPAMGLVAFPEGKFNDTAGSFVVLPKD
ncbi:MAG: radical SAM protein, partial [Terracidiphilus sp.]